MRVTKGLWAAMGAGVSLAAAALIALATMSVVLAVGGWPNGHYVAREGSVALQAQRSVAHSTAASTPAATSTATPPARRGL
jgi:D-tyrosyl-tRNA(Tyr) deacylase